MKNQNKKIPQIRFKSFEKRWESYRLSEYSSYRRGSFPQPYGNKEWYGGDNAMPFVQVVDVLENLRLAADTKQKISTLAQPMSVFVPSDSVIVTLQGSIGRVAITQYDAYVDRTILTFEDYISQTNKEFWAYTIRNKFEIERQKAPGGTIKTITKEALSDFKVSIPNYSEQSAIGSLFRTLDDLLSSYKDNLTSYQSLKATMLSKMFPKAGQTVPEIRLDGFDGEWEIKKFKSISNKRGKSNSKGYDYPAYSVSNQSGLIPQSEQFEGSRLENLEKTSYKIVEPNEFAYNPARINVGSIAFNDLHETVIVSSLYVIFSLDKSMDNNYALLFIKSAEFNKEVRRNTEGSVREYLFYENFANIRIPIPPSLEEQHAIGIYFSNLDNLINSHQEKISQLETLKKKLLQDMFI